MNADADEDEAERENDDDEEADKETEEGNGWMRGSPQGKAESAAHISKCISSLCCIPDLFSFRSAVREEADGMLRISRA